MALEKIQNLFHDVNSGALSELPLEVGLTSNDFTEKKYLRPFFLRCLFCIIAGCRIIWGFVPVISWVIPWWPRATFSLVSQPSLVWGPPFLWFKWGPCETYCRSSETITALPQQLKQSVILLVTPRTGRLSVVSNKKSVRIENIGAQK